MEYIENSTYSRSISSNDSMTCTKFDYSSRVSCGSILCFNWHQKNLFGKVNILLIHVSSIRKKENFSINKKRSQISIRITNLNSIKKNTLKEDRKV